MGGCSFEDDYESTSPLTLVLVGRTGNGKSATRNSIIGLKKFQSKRTSSGVTTTSELRTAALEDGRMINMIDTPGLLNFSIDHEFIGKEIVRCVDMSRNGIHAVLLVFSICNRFSDEEKSVLSSLLTFFGSKIYDNIIVVFFGGDELEDDGKTLEDYLCSCPEALKKCRSEVEEHPDIVRDEQFKLMLELFESKCKEGEKKAEAARKEAAEKGCVIL